MNDLGGNATLILADVGAGKTSLLAYFLKQIYNTKGALLKDKCHAALSELNIDRENAFTFPDEPPIYTDITSFKMNFITGFNGGDFEYYEPYGLNPYYIGVGRDPDKTQYVLPYGQIFIPEIQKYCDSRNSNTFPRAMSRLFEIRRHFNLDLYMDGHRGNFVDLKVRGMCNRIIDLIKQEHTYDGLKRIVKTYWYCREFNRYDDYEAYYKGEAVDYKETVYENRGNIFEDYDSFGCEAEFVPPEGAQFITLKNLSAKEIKELPDEIAKFYNPTEPSWFRSKKAT